MLSRGGFGGDLGGSGGLGVPEGKENWQPRADKLEVHLTLLAEKMLLLFHCKKYLVNLYKENLVYEYFLLKGTFLHRYHENQSLKHMNYQNPLHFWALLNIV